jgi:hypothetical protein
MLSIILIVALASVFYRIGDHEYTRKGWLLALLSLILSFAGGSTGFGFLGILGANLVLYLICLGYNLISNKPPSSGF